MSVQPAVAGLSRELPDLVGRIRGTGRCELLLQVIDVASFTARLRRPGPFTLLAPPDAAFIDLPNEAVNELLEDQMRARAFIREHVAPGAFHLCDLRTMRRLTTLSGHDLPVSTDDGIRLGGNGVTQPDLLAANGIAHLVDGLLLR